MHIIAKVVSFIFLPPGLFIILFIGLLVLTYRIKRTTARLIMGLIILLMYLFSIEPVSRLLLSPLEGVHPFRTADSLTGEEADAIVVLGAGLQKVSGKENGPETAGDFQPSTVTLARLVHGYSVYRKTDLPLVVTGGSPFGADPPEATIMRDWLIGMGVPEARVFPEEESRNTAENARNVATMQEYSRIILVTSAGHMPRSVWLFEKEGMQIVPAPTDYRGQNRGAGVWAFFPRPQSLEGSYRALHEYGGILFNLIQYANRKKRG